MSSASRGLAPHEDLECLLVKMGRAGPLVEPHHGPQEGKSGDPCSQNANRLVKTSKLACMRVNTWPKARSGLASRRSQWPSTEHRGPPKPAASVDVRRLIGRGRLRFPTLPWQLPV